MGYNSGSVRPWFSGGLKDAQHLQGVIGRQAALRPARHVAAAIAVTGLIPIRPHHIRRWEAAAGAEVAALAGLVAEEGRVGPERVLPWCTRPLRCGRSHHSVKPSKGERPRLTFGMSSFATRGTVGEGQLRNSTICSNLTVSQFGSVKRTCCSVRRCSARLTKGWQSLE